MTAVPIDVKRKVAKGFATYMGYFGSRYVGNDIQVLCGNIFDHELVKTVTLFCIMFQATDNVRIALWLTFALSVIKWVMTEWPVCDRYVDKTISTGKPPIKSAV
jgi:hypothetical protein